MLAPATEHSSLRFLPDPGCNGDTKCVCDSLPKPWTALVIRDLVPVPDNLNDCESDGADCSDQGEGNEVENGDGPDNPEVNVEQTRTTIGYDYDSDVSGRHHLFLLGYDPKTISDDAVRAKVVLEMAHELGHACGLGHEHQRADRDKWIQFSCPALTGYEAAIERVKEDFPKDDCPEDPDPEDCLANVVCENYDLARKYFPNAAAAYITADQILGWHVHVNSKAFDYNSIMIYSSYQMADDPEPDDFPSGAVLIGHPPNVDPDGDYSFPFYQGGSFNPATAQVSNGDIARIAQLYDKGTPDGDAAKDLDNWGQAKVKRADMPTTLSTVASPAAEAMGTEV